MVEGCAGKAGQRNTRRGIAAPHRNRPAGGGRRTDAVSLGYPVIKADGGIRAVGVGHPSQRGAGGGDGRGRAGGGAGCGDAVGQPHDRCRGLNAQSECQVRSAVRTKGQ